jgi:isopenicillin-N N-acyltransferase-like protein
MLPCEETRVTTPMPIPLIRVRGDHREVGRQIGEACADEIARACDLSAHLGDEQTVYGQRALAAAHRDVTGRAEPWLLEELGGVAEGADVDALDLFAASTEEIWGVVPVSHGMGAGAGRCSDLVATAPLTADGHVVVGHTNDLSPKDEADLVALWWEVDDEPPMFTIGIGPWLSVGWNAAGLSLTGNELTPNDNRVGVPRVLQVRDMLRKRTIDEAVAAALRPDRASSYSNVLAHRDGSVVCVEGSASDAELMRADDGTLAHTNHYVTDRMLGYEGAPEYAKSSAVRYRRARTLLDGMREGGTPVTMESMRTAISDHEGDPSICRHEREGSDVKTVFWCVADVTAGRVAYGHGNPCDSVEQEMALV